MAVASSVPDADDERSEWDEDQLAAEEQAEVEAMTIAAEAGGKRDAEAQPPSWWSSAP